MEYLITVARKEHKVRLGAHNGEIVDARDMKYYA